jgi:sodium/proline symporter
MIILVPVYTIMNLGGLQATLDIIADKDPSFLLWQPANWITTIIAICSWGLGTFGQPHILINFMSIDKPENVKKAKIVGVTWQILALSSATLVAIAGKAFFVNELANREMVFITLVQTLFSPFFGGFILCAILAATISTINTQSLVSGSLLSHDLIQPLFKESLTEKAKVILSRASLILFPLVSFTIAWNPTKNILDTVLYAWSGLGASLAPILLLALYNKRITKWGAISGLLSGAVTAIIWPHVQSDLPTLVVGFAINLIVTLNVSYTGCKHSCSS